MPEVPYISSPLLSVYPLISFRKYPSHRGKSACSSRFFGSVIPDSFRCLSMIFFASSGDFYSPHPAECVHIKRQIIQLVFINCYRRINIVIKLRKLIYIIPYFLSDVWKNMRSVLMHMNPFYIFTVNISGNVISFIDHKT